MPVSRRRFLASSSFVLAGLSVDLRSVFAQGTAAQAPPQTAFGVVRGTVGFFTGQGGVIGWHVDRTSTVVIDSQFAATAKTCLDGIQARNGGHQWDYLVNTHHHGDHTGGNGVFRPVAKKILAHENVPTLQREAAARAAKSARPDAAPQPEPVVADATYTHTWRENVGGEVMALKYYGPAHTSGDSVVTFEKANVVHMGDLVFNRRHPFIDRPAGASVANWVKVLEQTVKDHAGDTIYIFGHSAPALGATGTRADLLYMRDYLTALADFVRGEIKAGKPREAIVTITDPLKGFPDHGPLIERVLAAVYDEVSA